MLPKIIVLGLLSRSGWIQNLRVYLDQDLELLKVIA